MPFRSQAQRALFYAASEKPGGAGGVSKAVADKFIEDDKPGKLPEKVKTKRQKALYDKG